MADKTFENEIEQWRKNNIGKASGPNSNQLSKLPDNIQRMQASEAEFSKKIDPFKQVSLLTEEYLVYRFYEKFPNVLILLKDIQSTGKIEDLRKLAQDSKLQYVLSFPKLTFYKNDGIGYASLAVQFYDYSANSLLIDTTYTGNWFNPGFEFACKDSSLSCTINNSISQALDKVIHEVASNSPTIKRQRKLWQDRLDILRNDYYPKSVDRSIVKKAIPAKDSNITMASLYQVLVSPDSSKFVAFFLEKKMKENFLQLSRDNSDKEVQVLTHKDIKDSAYLDDIPQTYAYIITAVKYNSRWYYKKAKVTYFVPEDNAGGQVQYFNMLQEWGFFEDNSTAFNADFWETHLFGKVKDLRKEPDRDKYGQTIWKREEEENRKYLGLYEIVADELKGGNKSPSKSH